MRRQIKVWALILSLMMGLVTPAIAYAEPETSLWETLAETFARETEEATEDETTEAPTEEAAEAEIVTEEAVTDTETEFDTEVTEEEAEEVFEVQEAYLAPFANVYEEADKNSRIVGRSFRGSNCMVLEQGETWCFVESGSVRGFVRSSMLTMGKTAEDAEDVFALVSVEKNSAMDYEPDTVAEPAVEE